MHTILQMKCDVVAVVVYFHVLFLSSFAKAMTFHLGLVSASETRRM